jgi:hypothetical protein
MELVSYGPVALFIEQEDEPSTSMEEGIYWGVKKPTALK